MITVRTPTGDKMVAAITLRTPTGDKAVARMVLRTPTGDKEIYNAAGMVALTVTASPVSAIGSAGSVLPINIMTNAITASASGGVAPYTYAWADTAPSADWTILSPAAATTRFQGNDVPEGASYFADMICTATDSRGATGTVSVPAQVINFGGF